LDPNPGLGLYLRPPPPARGLETSELMAAYWTNVKKRRNPNGKGVPKWPVFRENRPAVMYFGDDSARTGPVPSEGPLKVLDRYFAWRRSPEGAVTQAPETRR
jgi:para-nitrobenzyl esterase